MSLARENQETALKELGRLLAVAREAATENTLGRRGEGDRPLNAAALSAWDYPKDEAQRFARFMVSVLSPRTWRLFFFFNGLEVPVYAV